MSQDLKIYPNAVEMQQGIALFKFWTMDEDGEKTEESESKNLVRGSIVFPDKDIPGYCLVASQGLMDKVITILYQHEFWQITPELSDAQLKEKGINGDIGLTNFIKKHINNEKCLTYYTVKSNYLTNRRYHLGISREKLIKVKPELVGIDVDDDLAENLITEYIKKKKVRIEKDSKLMVQLKNRSNTPKDNAVLALKVLLTGYDRYPYQKREEWRFY
jgi:hypothetical protein